MSFTRNTLLSSILLLGACSAAQTGQIPDARINAGTLVSARASACGRLASVDVVGKKGDCALAPTYVVDETECRPQIASCSAQDVQSVDAFAACMEALPTCHAGREKAFQEGVDSCAGWLKDVSCAGSHA